MARLVAGRPRVTDGRLTVANLAREAGVGRSTANRAVDVLDAFHKAAARVPRPRAPEADTAAVRSRDAAEIADLKATVNQLAQQVQRMAMRDANSTGPSMRCVPPSPKRPLAKSCRSRRSCLTEFQAIRAGTSFGLSIPELE